MNIGLKIALTPIAFLAACFLATVGDVSRGIFVRLAALLMIFGGLTYWIWSL